MKLDEFLEKHSGAPYDDDKLAEIAALVEDDKLSRTAFQFIDAQAAFYAQLDRVGYERG